MFFDELDELEAEAENNATERQGDTFENAGGGAKVNANTAHQYPREARDVDASLKARDPLIAHATRDLEPHRNTRVLSLQQARHVQSLIIRAYLQEGFQASLHAAIRKAQADAEELAAACERLSIEAQMPLAQEYGFPGSAAGVALLGSAFVLYAADAEVHHRSALMRWLVDPSAQLTVPIPRGPAKCILKAVARVLEPNGNPVWESSIHLNSTVRALKENVGIAVRKPWHCQRLFLGEKELFDQDVLSSLVYVNSVNNFRLQFRRPEVVEWLMRLKKGVDTLKEAPSELLNDPEFILAAVQIHACVMQYVATELQQDRAFLERVVAHCGQALQFVQSDLRDDHRLVLLAVQHDAWALEFAAPELQAMRDIVLAAVQQDGEALQFAARELQTDTEIVLTAIRKQPSVILQVPELQRDRKVVVKAVMLDWHILESVSEEMRSDREVVSAAVRQSGQALQHAAPERRADLDVVLLAVKNHGEALRFAAPQLRRDRTVVLAAVRRFGMALGIADPVSQDLEVALAAVTQDRRAIIYVDQRWKKEVARKLDIDLATEGNPWLEKQRTRAQVEEGPPDDLAEVAGISQHFAVLNLPDTASKDEVKKRYHQLALQYHPDKYLGDAEVAKEMFQKIHEAYDMLVEALDL